MRVISCRTQLEVMHDFQTDKRNTWLNTVIKEDAVNFMRYFRPTYCLISMQACNKSLFAFPLSSFCLLVILPWVVWVSGLTLFHSNQFTPHTRLRGLRLLMIRTEWQSDKTELNFAVASESLNPLWIRFLPLPSLFPLSVVSASFYRTYDAMLFWRTSALLKTCRWNEDPTRFRLSTNAEEFIYKPIIGYDCSYLSFIFLVFSVNVLFGSR